MEVYCTTCSKTKNKTPKPLQAKDRYISDRIGSISELAQKDNVPFFILSGKIGLIKETAQIPYYDVPLEDDMVDEMVKKVVIQLNHYKITKINFYGVLRDKNPSWKPYYDLIERACEEAGVALNEEIIN